MQTYKEVYTFYEESDLHKSIQEVQAAEEKYRKAINDLARIINQTTLEELDQLFGIICRSYEMQGFAFAQAVYDIKDGWIKVAPKTAEQIKSATTPRAEQTTASKQNNSFGKNNVPCRTITSNGITKTVSEWLEYLAVSPGTFYFHLNQGNLDEWISRKLQEEKKPDGMFEGKTINGVTRDGYPCRYIESNGMRMNCSEWIAFLKCSNRSFYENLKKGEDVLDRWITQRLLRTAAKV